MAGYSTTPLAKKLGIKENFTIKLINEPDYYWSLFTDKPENIKIVKKGTEINLVHIFSTKLAEIETLILKSKTQIKQNGIIWASWAKKTSKIPTDITEDLIRNIALANGLVDIKVCAINEIWSGLKLVIPVKDRKS
jgi:hypothetical protein